MRRDGVGRLVLLVFASLLLLPALSGVLSYFVTPGSSTTLAPAALAPYLIALAVPSLIAFLLCRQRWGSLISGALVLVLIALQAPLYFADDPPSNGRDLVVMTANLRLGQADAADVVNEVRSHKVEVFMAQELTPELQSRLVAAGLDQVLPFRITKPSFAAVGNGLWSKYPLTSTAVGDLTFPAVAARVTVPGVQTKPTLVALHVAGPVPDATNWSRDMDRLPGVLDALSKDAPVLVGGDFNATLSVNRFRHLLENGFEDAGSQAGAGLLRTYPSNRSFPPVLGIDHVLTRGGAVGTNAETLQINATDHRALLTTVAVPRTS